MHRRGHVYFHTEQSRSGYTSELYRQTTGGRDIPRGSLSFCRPLPADTHRTSHRCSRGLSSPHPYTRLQGLLTWAWSYLWRDGMELVIECFIIWRQLHLYLCGQVGSFKNLWHDWLARCLDNVTGWCAFVCGTMHQCYQHLNSSAFESHAKSSHRRDMTKRLIDWLMIYGTVTQKDHIAACVTNIPRCYLDLPSIILNTFKSNDC